MPLTAEQLNRATLERQLLLRREPIGVADAVHRVMALQAQSPVSPYLAVWNRVAGFDPADLDAMFATQAIVKATLMRATLHAVDFRDYPAFHGAMQTTLRAARLADPRFTTNGLSADDAEALVPHLLDFATQPRTSAEFEAMIDARLGGRMSGVWWAVRPFVPMLHAVTGGAWSFGTRPAYVAAPVDATAHDREEAQRYLFRRYLAAFGPAGVADAAQFTRIARSTARRAILGLGDDVVRLEGPGGAELFDLAGAPLPAASAAAPPRLLAMWDSVLLAYADRSRIIPPEYRAGVIRRNGDVLPTLLVDGHVAGVWRPVADGIEAAAFRPLSAREWRGLAVEARGVAALLGSRDATVYRRYARWWRDLPVAETRVLPGR